MGRLESEKMKILDLFKKSPFRPGPLQLDEKDQAQWAPMLVAHLELDKDFAEFSEDMQELSKKISASLRTFSDEGVLAAIPDRARTMNALHGNEYATQVQKQLKTVEYSDLFSFDRQQDAFIETSSAFKDQTAKNTTKLKEFLHDELKQT